MALDIPFGADTAGIAGSYTETINNTNPFLTGDHPPVVTRHEPVGASTTILARTPVYLNAGVLAPAVSGTPAIGITVTDVVVGAGVTGKTAPIYRQGVFNPAMINWPASYTTDALKRVAFDGAATPTAIVLREPKTLTV